MSRTIRVLSIDGGGIRGVIPAMVLAEIEKVTERPIAESFDLIAGTSTGGILALALTKPDASGKPAYSACDLVSLYEQQGHRIFHRNTWHRLHAAGNLLDEKYPAEGLEEVLAQYFGEARLKEALTDVLITGYETERRFPFFFKSANARVNPEYDFPMRLVARATSAAPTYFEPLKLPAEGTAGYYSLIDGGVYANNPSMCALVEAITRNPEADNFLVVSIGTGESTYPLRHEDIKDWGLASWAQPVLNIVFDGVSNTVDYQLRQLLTGPGEPPRYWRFQLRLDSQTGSMDDASPDHIRRLKLLAESLIRERSVDIQTLSASLRRAS